MKVIEIVKISQNRITVPQDVRKEMKLKDGDKILWKKDGNIMENVWSILDS